MSSQKSFSESLHSSWPALHQLQSVIYSLQGQCWCVEPVSNEAFYYLNPQMTPSLPLSLPPSPSPSLTVCILPIYAALGSSLLFLLERKRTRQARDKKIALRQNSLSLKLPGRGGGMEGAKASSFCREAVEERGEPCGSSCRGERQYSQRQQYNRCRAEGT